MSALENPAALANLWQDPWCSAVAASGSNPNVEDFYQPNKGNVVQAGFYHHHHQPMAVHAHAAMHHHHHGYHPQQNNQTMLESSGGQNNNNNSMNSDANSSSTTSSTTSSSAKDLNKPHRQVNFKLDIKAEPELEQNNGMQKVPSISDLSDPDSSLDIPCSQVRNISSTRSLLYLTRVFSSIGSAINPEFKQESERSPKSDLCHLGQRFRKVSRAQRSEKLDQRTCQTLVVLGHA